MYKRPNVTETDEDLLRMQKEFNAKLAENKLQVAAKVIKTDLKDDKPGSSSKEETYLEIQEQIENTFEAIPTNSRLGQIIPKEGAVPVIKLQFNNDRGFPRPKRRDVNITSSRGSTFSQQMKKLRTNDESSSMEVEAVPSCSNTPKKCLASESYILTGPDKSTIHEENLKVLNSMSEGEILEEKAKLQDTMDPALIAFLKNRRKKLEKLQQKSLNPTIKEQNEAAGDINLELIRPTSEILSKSGVDKWLHFDTVETNKLAWMKDVEVQKITKKESFEARFDFDGWLLPFTSEEITEKNRILYHHGEEAERPGYTLQELFQLSRSSVGQQKIIALNTIGNILCLYGTGVYQDVIELPIEQIFFVLRFCLDENTPSVLNASIRAMRHLIFCQMDETCLDSLLGFGIGLIQPILPVDHDKEDDNTVNDQQLAETNLIKCLARTEIFTRIRYIINTVKPNLETIIYCLDILIRMSRDSDYIIKKLFKAEGLIQSVIDNFVPKVYNKGTDSPYGTPLLQAIKLMRVLSVRSKSFAKELINCYSILDSIAVYISDDYFTSNVNGLRLQIECFHLLEVLVHYDLALEVLQVCQPVLLKMLDFHLNNTNLNLETTFVRQGHVSSLLTLCATLNKSNFTVAKPTAEMISSCFRKWVLQFTTLNSFVCGKLQMISSLFVWSSSIYSHKSALPDEFLDVMDGLLNQLVISPSFTVCTNSVKSGSMLLNDYAVLKCSPNLKTLETSAWYTLDHVIPLVQSTSCLPFLAAMSEYLLSSDSKQAKLNFLKHENIVDYIKALNNMQKYFLTSKWFTRFESQLIMNLLKLSVQVQNDLDTSMFYELAVKTLSIYTIEQKSNIEYILNNVIFCASFYPPEVLLRNLDIAQRSENLELSLNNLVEIQEVYKQVLGLNSDIPDFSSQLFVDLSVGNIIPIDWIYTPIIVLYSNQQDNKNVSEEQQIFSIKNCLRWILIYETYFPRLMSFINPTDIFCRIACVFLGSDNLFLNSEIHALLEICLKNLMGKCQDKLNFDKHIEGLSNFQDFYTQLLEQYQGVSYGDILFGNFILIPLAQKHNVQWRKTLWSEYMGAVQTFNVTESQMFDNVQGYLFPPEEDMSLLKCYRRALVSGLLRKHSVLFKIANHHVEQYIKRKK